MDTEEEGILEEETTNSINQEEILVETILEDKIANLEETTKTLAKKTLTKNLINDFN